MRKKQTLPLSFLVVFSLCLLAGCGGGSGKVTPPLSKTVPLGANGTFMFPGTPKKQKGSYTTRFGIARTGPGETHTEEAVMSRKGFTYEAACIWFDVDDIEINMLSLLQNEFKSHAFKISVNETLADETRIHEVIGMSDKNEPQSMRVVTTPDGRNYISKFKYKASAIPTPEQIEHEKAFHHSLKVNGTFIEDSLDEEADQLYATRIENDAASEAIDKAHRERMDQRIRDSQQIKTLLQENSGGRNLPVTGQSRRDSPFEESGPQQYAEQARTSTAGIRGRFAPPAPDSSWNEENEPPVQISEDDMVQNLPPPGAVQGFNPFANKLGNSMAGKAFSETTPEGFVLVGFAVTLKMYWNTPDCIESIQPLYRFTTGTATKRGTVHGNTTGESKQVFAPAGYAFGALNGRSGLVVDGFELVCMKINPDGSLDTNDTKTSPWVGHNDPGGNRTTIDGKGKPVKEIKGFISDHLSSLEFVFE